MLQNPKPKAIMIQSIFSFIYVKNNSNSVKLNFHHLELFINT